jgi:thiol:disulfide interchange protein DsbD
MRRRVACILSAVLLLGLAGAAGGAGDAARPSVTLVPPAEAARVPTAGEGEATLRIAIAPGYHVYARNDQGYIPLAVASRLEGVEVLATLPAPKTELLLGEKVPVYEGELEARLALRLSGGRKPGERLEVPVEVSWQACNEQYCEEPARATVKVPVMVVEGTGAAPARERAPRSAEATPAAKPEPAPAATGGARPGGSLFAALAGALLAGLGVTLTPCVYPLIPVTVSYFQQQASGSRARAMPLAVAYGLGIVVMYAALGVIAARIGRDLGAVLGNPFVGWGFVLLFVLFAASMFGLFDMALPSSVATRLQSGERGGTVGALLLGLTLGLVAAPCTGPVAGGLILIVAQTGDLAFGLAAFGAFGAGLALPFMALGVFSGALGSLPRAGAWMNTVKHVFGFLLLGFAIYFVNVVLGSERVVFALAGALLIAAGAAAAIGGARRLARRKVAFGAVSLLAAGALVPAGAWLLAGPYVLAETARYHPDRVFASKIAWRKDHDAALAAARAAGKPVMIDFTARWCLPCQELELSTFRDEEVVREAARFVAVKVDITSDEAAQRLKRERYDSAFVPFIAFYDSKGEYLPEKSFTRKPTTEEFLARLKEIR